MNSWKQLATGVALALGLMAAPANAQTSDLFFSEYIEGGGNNKALEIYNGTGAPVNLAAGVYRIELYANGGTTLTASEDLTGTIADGDVYVIAHQLATAAFTGVADLILNGDICNFNGDDALYLKKNGVIIDHFGEFDWDPGTAWSEGGIDTVNQTLIRKSTVCDPNPAGFSNDTADPFTLNGVLAAEWDEQPQDTSSFLGSHTASCSADAIAPNATVVVPTGQGPSNTDKVSFFVTFDEAVQNFDAIGDLTINTTGSVTVGGASFTGTLSNYVVTLNGVDGNGTVALAVSTGSDVQDLAANALASSVTSAAVTIANSAPASGVLLSETWSGATAGVLSTTSATLVADNGWDITASAASGTVQISDFSGDKAVEHTADGTSAEFNFVAPTVQTVDASTKSVKFEYETEYNALGTNGSRQWVVQAYASTGSLDGYQIRFTGETDSGAVLDVAIIDNGVVGSSVDVPPASGAQATGKRYKVTVVFTKAGADTVVSFQAENLTDGGFIVPVGTQTIVGESLDSGTSFDTTKIFARARTRSLLDDLNITFDVTPPVISLDGADPLNISCGSTYTDPGATAADDFDGDISGDIVVDSSGVDTNTAGNYTVFYNVTDASGNAATQVEREVIVGSCADVVPPVITLQGTSPVNVNCGATYNDEGASATDNVDNSITLTAAIVTGGLGAINTSVPGTYTVTYNVLDTAGNPANEVTRTVNVLNNCPLISIDGPSGPVVEGDAVTLSVNAPALTGAVSYEWRKDGDVLGDEMDDAIIIANVSLSDAGEYVVLVTDQSKAAFPPSAPYTLVVNPLIGVPVVAWPAGIALGLALLFVSRRKK